MSELKETSSDFDCGENSEDTCEDLSTTYERPKSIPFTTRITHFRYHWRAKLPRNIKVYESSKDPEDHLGIFSAVEEYAKDPTEIHGIKRRLNEGLQAFIDQFKLENSHIKGVPPVLRISTFMHSHRHPELSKKLNDKMTVDEMFERVRAFIKGEVTTGSAKAVKAPQWDKRNAHVRWFGGQERIRGRSGPRKFQRIMGTCAPYSRRDTWHNTKDCYHLKKHIEEVLALGKRAHLVKDIRQVNVKEVQRSLCWVLGEIYPLGLIYFRVTMGESGKNKTVLLEFAIVKCRLPYNIILRKTGMRSLRAVGSTVHSMIKFPMVNGVATLKTSRETLRSVSRSRKRIIRGRKHNGDNTWSRCQG
nr:reverse transcriptase domain-containing protein [Tanacetum cinerariifolium]